jgi:hypothetical protein
VSREAISTSHPESVIVSSVIVYAILDIRSSPDHPLGDAVETFIPRDVPVPPEGDGIGHVLTT